ncbi:MAG: tRNA uridine-5-carboxymethylaminomethyl(34) synthesis GTPase MnmE [Alphaproteobacteria bacterium]|nr:tRNA uridine-5-carboxymethylaminomethyl(34) synthesis GTPase MnmE [Alphaproteobacteria bacterium]MBU2144028.1 tRNA uridine-5-carboxymethylaminomethyl(34) synthesis GTPase MnmE [Alphaproteobacteria bacterium]MBU2198143.1 tRNA uridine-5-carboxymethylaminomethyl(34) synthesis GTPase MnmE [Alphaproteobacteria bacterium]
MSERDTICALASGAPPAAIAILRLSGPQVRQLADRHLGSGLPAARHATLTDMTDDDGVLVDRGLALFMPGPGSYTGEDTLELYLHGGAAVIAHALETLTAHVGVRMAEPGEYTRRAFEAGKLDLTEAEGVADIIEAETVAQKAQALRQLGGGLSETYDQWRAELTGVLALVEVAIDFPDEGDAPQDTTAPILAKLGRVIGEMETALGDGGIGERIRDGFRVAIIGAPNAGKSTLLNRLARREAAIVTAKAGTTRDVIEVRRVLGGHVVWIADTAGLRVTVDEIEAEGVRRAEVAAREADLRLFVLDAGEPDTSHLSTEYRLDTDIVVVNKSDLGAAPDGVIADHVISARDGFGVDALEQAIAQFVDQYAASVEAPVITRQRHRARLTQGLSSLEAAQDALEQDVGAELAAEDIRMALRQLGSIIGVVGVEDVLGAVFSEFCIGK